MTLLMRIIPAQHLQGGKPQQPRMQWRGGNGPRWMKHEAWVAAAVNIPPLRVWRSAWPSWGRRLAQHHGKGVLAVLDDTYLFGSAEVVAQCMEQIG